MIFQSNQMVNAKANTRVLEERIRNLEFQNRRQEPQFYTSQERQRDTEGGSSRGGPRRSSNWQTRSPNDA